MEVDHRGPERVRQRPTRAANHVIGEFVTGWLTRHEMSLAGHGARCVPSAFPEAPLQGTNSKSGSGSRNAARVKHPAEVLSKRTSQHLNCHRSGAWPVRFNGSS